MNGANERMIRDQIVARGIHDERVLDAFRSVPRELFVPPHHRDEAYDDTPLPLDCRQTISQPFIVALMTEKLRLTGEERVLEIGTGSGYQTAILARLAKFVYSCELERDLLATVRSRLDTLGIENVLLRLGDGVEAFKDQAPFDAILSAAAAPTMPEELFDQLAEGGRAIVPVGTDSQWLWMVVRTGERLIRDQLEPVRFVPLRK
jgi:protein-L-isoaspartate(D-aspartate) O-methyltransferase